MDSILDEIAGHGIAFIDLCAEMREIVKSKWRRTDSPPQNLLRCLIASGSDEASPPLLQVEVSTWLVAFAPSSHDRPPPAALCPKDLSSGSVLVAEPKGKDKGQDPIRSSGFVLAASCGAEA